MPRDPRDNDRKWEDRGRRTYDDFTDKPKRTIGKWVLWGVLALLALLVVGGVVRWVTGWGGEAARIVSVDNVRQQQTQVIGTWQSLMAAADNACQASDVKTNENSPTFVEDPALAYAAQFRSLKADYQRRTQNLFEAKIVMPGNYPRIVPNYPELRGPNPDWCGVSEKMALVHE